MSIEHAVDDAARRQIGVEHGRQPGHRLRRRRRASAAAARLRAVGLGEQLPAAASKPPVMSEARQVVAEDPPQDGRARVGGRALSRIPHLALAEDEHAAAAQVGVEAREREAGLLRMRDW